MLSNGSLEFSFESPGSDVSVTAVVSVPSGIVSVTVLSCPPRNTLIVRCGMARWTIGDSIGGTTGWLLATEGCLPSALGARVRSSNGKLSVTDGPFTESKEVVGGFAILRANSKEEAIQLAKDFLHVAGDGECEIRQIFEADTCVQKAATT